MRLFALTLKTGLVVLALLLAVAPVAAEKTSDWRNLQQVSGELQAAIRGGRFPPTLSIRYNLLAFYAKKMDDDNKAFSSEAILEFAADTRDMTIVSEPSQPILNSCHAMEELLKRLAASTGVGFREAPDSVFTAQPPLPVDPQERGSQLHATLQLIADKAGSLRAREAAQGQSQTPQAQRLQADLTAIQSSAEALRMALEQGTANDAYFGQLQAARARLQLSRSGFGITSRVAGDDLLKLCQSCAELWRTGR